MKLFLDMDGVLCDFFGRALQVHEKQELAESWPPGEWDMPSVIGVSKTQFWKQIKKRRDFWRTLRPTPEFERLIALADSIDPAWHIASSPAHHVGSASGKLWWLQKHIDKGFRRFLLGPSKHLLAGTGRVLVDDSDRNIEEFCAAGGIGVLWPQPWNAMHAFTGDKVEYLTEVLSA